MKFVFLVLFVFLEIIHSQDNDQLKFLTEIKIQEGTWVADNSAYPNDGIEKYAIDWTLSPLKNSLYGKLYGINGTKEIGPFWTFHKYYNPNKKKVILMQIGSNGTMGIGAIEYLQNNNVKLVQTFTTPKGENREEGHEMFYPDDQTEIGSSFSIDNNGNWTKKRTYTWKKIQTKQR